VSAGDCAGARLGPVGHGAPSDRARATEPRPYQDPERAGHQASGAPCPPVPLRRRVPAGAAADGGDREPGAADHPGARPAAPGRVSREMGLPILGVLPHFKGRPGNGDQAGRTPRDVAQLVEALRGVCLNLVYAYGAAGPMVVTITSPGPGDGKSFLAANLAHT